MANNEFSHQTYKGFSVVLFKVCSYQSVLLGQAFFTVLAEDFAIPSLLSPTSQQKLFPAEQAKELLA